jgi:hypothetical protein
MRGAENRLGKKPKLGSRKAGIEKLRELHEANVQKAQATKDELAAMVQAGRMAIDATNQVQDLCAAVEATQLPDQHRELLEQALLLASAAIGKLASIQPINDSAAWIRRKSTSSSDQASVAQARRLRDDTSRFAAFSRLLTESLEALRVRASTIEHLQAEMADLPPGEPSVPHTLGGQCQSAQSLLSLGAQRTHDGASLVAAWTQARSAQDVLDGAVLLLEPAMREYPWPDNRRKSAAACLTIIAGAIVMARGIERISAEPVPALPGIQE